LRKQKIDCDSQDCNKSRSRPVQWTLTVIEHANLSLGTIFGKIASSLLHLPEKTITTVDVAYLGSATIIELITNVEFV